MVENADEERRDAAGALAIFFSWYAEENRMDIAYMKRDYNKKAVEIRKVR